MRQGRRTLAIQQGLPSAPVVSSIHYKFDSVVALLEGLVDSSFTDEESGTGEAPHGEEPQLGLVPRSACL